MKKNELITIKCIKANKDYDDYSEDMLESLNINLTNNFLFRMFYRYRNIKMEQHNYCEDLIKVELNKNEEQAKKRTRIEFNGITYIPLITSPSLMKFEEDGYKCSYIYINEEYKEFIEIFKTCVSLEKLSDKIGEELCINKDVIARLSLAMSGSYRVAYKPNIVILDEKKYKYTSRYVTVNSDFKLTPVSDEGKDTYTKTHTFSDGAGFMSPKMAKVIQNDLHVDYPVDFAVIRQYCGLAVKGLVVKADFNQYFEDNYVADTDTFKRDETGDFWVLDYFGKPQNISKVDLILNKSQVKWAKWFSSMEEVEELIKDKYYDNYRDLLNSLYVTKINKKEPKKYTKTNYQLISNLALTPAELRQLSKPTEQYFKDITSNNPDIDKLRIFLGDTMHQDLTDLEENEKIETELTASTKIHYLIQSNPGILKTAGVMQVIKSLCKKQVSQIAGARFYVKGNYKILAPDPIAYLNLIMGNAEEYKLHGALKEREFYVPNETGKRTLSRNPLNSFSEIQKANLVKNETLDKYFGNHTSELLFLNAVDDTAMLMSGADEDGDMALCVDNDIIYNAVVPKIEINGLQYDFINLADGKNETWIYNERTEFESAIEGSGNLIGSISNLGMIITNNSQEFTYKNVLTGDFVTYNQLLNAFIKKYGDRKEYQAIQENIETYTKLLEANLDSKSRKETREQIKGFKKQLDDAFRSNLQKRLEELEKESKIVNLNNLSDAEIKQQFINQFHKNAKYSYYALYLQMLAIDSPKTGLAKQAKEKAEDFKEIIKEKFGTTKKPGFINYSKAKNYDSKEDKERDKFRYNKTHSLLNKNIGKVYKNIIDVDKEFNNEKLEKYFEMLLFNNPTNVLNSTLLLSLESIRDNWKLEREKFKDTEFRSKYDYEITDKSNYYNLIDLKYTKKINELLEEYSINEIAFTLKHIQIKSSKFITNCCWTILKSKVDEQFKNVYKYNLNENGDIDWLFKKYTRILVNRESGDSITTNLEKRAEKFQTKKINFLLDETIENDMDLTTITIKKINDENIELYDNNGLKAGTVYKDHEKKCVFDTALKVKNATIKESINKKTNIPYKYVAVEFVA